jgi:hypothetical protein
MIHPNDTKLVPGVLLILLMLLHTGWVNLYVLMPKMSAYRYDQGVPLSLKSVIKALYPSALLLK